MRDKVTGNTQK